MAQRGESKHKERFVQRQRNARPNKAGLPRPLVVPLRVPLLVIFQVVHGPHGALIKAWSELFRYKRIKLTFTFSTRLKHLWRERLCRTAF